MTEKLQVALRTLSAKAVRNIGEIPAVVYGPKQESLAISVPEELFEKTLKSSGKSTVIKLVGLDKELDVLIRDVSYDTLLKKVKHVDFFALEKGKEITVHVPIEFIGEAPAIEKDGILIKLLEEIEVTCSPSALPHFITVDVSSLDELEKKIHVKDITLPKGVHATNDMEDVIVLVREAKEEVEEENEEATEPAAEEASTQTESEPST